LHVYVLYPIQLYILGSFLDRSVEIDRPDEELPTVSLVVAAYNEAEIIEDKILNSLELDYPEEKLDIVVFSDASSDGTDEIARSYRSEGVHLERIEGRVGKTECQNRVTAMLETDIIVYSDADSMYEPNAIRRLVARFDEDVGCVVGELRYRNYGVEAESAYRRLEQLIKRLEPRVSSIVGGNGSIYAVRRDSYVPLPPDQISDFAEPLAVVRNGERAEYAHDAIAWENTGETTQSEMTRRIRISTRLWHGLTDYLELLNPVRYPLFSYQLASHMPLRWLSPVYLAVAGISNVALVLTTGGLLYPLLLAGQAVCYAAAGIGGLLDRLGLPNPKPLYVPYYFLVLNYSLLIGLTNFLRNRNIVTWETETRVHDSD
jgi:glycosyltransferase involved in cell wall biosynthesis